MRTQVGLFLAIVALFASDLSAADKPQYEFEAVKVPAARADEPVRETFSLKLAAEHLEQGNLAWSNSRKCVSCHTNGTYMSIRPALTPVLGPPPAAAREFFVSTLKTLKGTPVETLRTSTRPAQVIYVAAGLAEWDAHVTKQLSPETEEALALMFDIQLESGTWGTLDCWPPFESDSYHEATVAAMAIGTAPGWLAKAIERGTPTADEKGGASHPSAPGVPQRAGPASDEKLKTGVARLKSYLATQTPLHDYSRVLLLWASTRLPDLLTDVQKQELVTLIFQHQREDGGWSVRTFAAPESWGGGNRAKKLREEPDFAAPASDGHQTGLSLIVLRSAGVDAKDPRMQKGVQWLLTHQRESGRWWTRSLNTDSWHFITYSGTSYPLLALSLCDALPTNAAASK